MEAVMSSMNTKPKSNKTLIAVIISAIALVLVVLIICTTVIVVSFINSDDESNDRDSEKTKQDDDSELSRDQFKLRIITDSMSPTFKAGDVIVCEKVTDPSQLKVGDIITYWVVIDGERVQNTHRITSIYDGGGYLIFETKGDANISVDPLTVHESEVLGKYVYTSPVSGVLNGLEDLFS